MLQNMSTTDRRTRAFLLAPVAVIAAVLLGAGTVAGVGLLIVAAVMLATSAAGFCPLYRLLGISTRRTSPPSSA